MFTAPQKRKQRKRTDARVTELEKEVQAMRSLINSKTGNKGSEHETALLTANVQMSRVLLWRHNVMDLASESSKLPMTSSVAAAPWMVDDSGASSSTLSGQRTGSQQVSAPVVQHNLRCGSWNPVYGTSTRTVDYVYEKLMPHVSVMVFPTGYTADELRRATPILSWLSWPPHLEK